MSNVSEKITIGALEVYVFGSGFSTVLTVGTSADDGYTYFISDVALTPKKARKLAKALRAAAKLRRSE